MFLTMSSGTQHPRAREPSIQLDYRPAPKRTKIGGRYVCSLGFYQSRKQEVLSVWDWTSHECIYVGTVYWSWVVRVSDAVVKELPTHRQTYYLKCSDVAFLDATHILLASAESDANPGVLHVIVLETPPHCVKLLLPRFNTSLSVKNPDLSLDVEPLTSWGYGDPGAYNPSFLPLSNDRLVLLRPLYTNTIIATLSSRLVPYAARYISDQASQTLSLRYLCAILRTSDERRDGHTAAGEEQSPTSEVECFSRRARKAERAEVATMRRKVSTDRRGGIVDTGTHVSCHTQRGGLLPLRLRTPPAPA